MIKTPGPDSQAWVKSSYSDGGGSNCVEWAPTCATAEAVPVRDSKDPHGPTLAFSPASWRAFVSDVVAGTFGTV